MLAQVELGAEKSHISCSIGVAIASGHASSFETVSYTHLDVYKRQIQDSSGRTRIRLELD